MISWVEKNIVLEWLEKETSRVGRKVANNNNNNSSILATRLLQLHQQANTPSTMPSLYSIHACSRRRLFYIPGTYTKSRRNKSQSPCYVSSTDIVGNVGSNNNNNGNNKSQFVPEGFSPWNKRLVLCPPMALVCRGIGQQNNKRLSKGMVSGENAPVIEQFELSEVQEPLSFDSFT